MAKVIRSSYSITTPESAAIGDFAESGMLDESGEDMAPDAIDAEEGLTAVDLAVTFLQRKAAVYPSSSGWHPGLWYSDEGSEDFRTGDNETRSYHLDGFTEDEARAVFTRVTARK